MQPPKNDSLPDPWFYYGFVLPVYRLFLKLYFGPIVITGREHVPKHGPAVLAVKHYSRWDPSFLYLLSFRPMRYMTNANQFEGIQGWCIRRLGAFPVDISRPQSSSLRHSIDLLHQGHKLVIFPEGGIVRDQPLRSLKPGLARLVLQAESTASSPISIPIIPIGLRYEPDDQRGAKVFINIGPPLFTSQVSAKERKQAAVELTEMLQTAMLQCLK